MSNSRWGGFRRGKRVFSDWDTRKAPSATVEESPDTVRAFDYTQAQGIWNLRSTMQFNKKNASVANLEIGLTTTTTVAATTNIANETYYYPDNNDSIVFACEVTFPVTPSDGQLWEIGGSGTGSWVGLRDSGTYFRVRAGDGGVSISGGAGSTSTCACLDITDFPTDGNVHTVIWELDRDNGTVKLWIDGTFKGSATASSGFESSLISGSGTGAYILGGTNIPGEPTGAWPEGTTGASDLRVYNDQSIT